MQEKEAKKLHGNRAKIDPQKNVAGLYATNMVTLANDTTAQDDAERENKIEYARKFDEENKK